MDFFFHPLPPVRVCSCFCSCHFRSWPSLPAPNPQIPSKDAILGLHLAMGNLLDLRWFGADLAIFFGVLGFGQNALGF
jgi:hypothetical protein